MIHLIDKIKSLIKIVKSIPTIKYGILHYRHFRIKHTKVKNILTLNTVNKILLLLCVVLLILLIAIGMFCIIKYWVMEYSIQLHEEKYKALLKEHTELIEACEKAKAFMKEAKINCDKNEPKSVELDMNNPRSRPFLVAKVILLGVKLTLLGFCFYFFDSRF